MAQSQVNTYEYGHVLIVVHRPALDENERQKRETALKRAVAAYGKAALKKEVENNG